MEVVDSGGTASRVRKMIVVLGVAGLVTWVMFRVLGVVQSLGEESSAVSFAAQAGSATFTAYVTAMCVLAIVYVSDTLLRDPLKMLSKRFGGGS